jgi:hypothetical protein
MRAHGREARVRGERDAAEVQRAVGLGWLGRLRWGMTAGSHLSVRHRRREATRAATGRGWAAGALGRC